MIGTRGVSSTYVYSFDLCHLPFGPLGELSSLRTDFPVQRDQVHL